MQKHGFEQESNRAGRVQFSCTTDKPQTQAGWRSRKSGDARSCGALFVLSKDSRGWHITQTELAHKNLCCSKPRITVLQATSAVASALADSNPKAKTVQRAVQFALLAPMMGLNFVIMQPGPGGKHSLCTMALGTGHPAFAPAAGLAERTCFVLYGRHRSMRKSLDKSNANHFEYLHAAGTAEPVTAEVQLMGQGWAQQSLARARAVQHFSQQGVQAEEERH